MIRISLLFAALALGACATTSATLSSSQCAADWRAVGRADGIDGAPAAKISQYREACARGGAPLSARDVADWRRGWDSAGTLVAAADAAPRDDMTLPDDHVGDHRRYDRHYEGGYDRGYSYYGPRISPFFGLSVGSRGTRVGAGFGVGFGLFRFGYGF